VRKRSKKKEKKKTTRLTQHPPMHKSNGTYDGFHWLDEFFSFLKFIFSLSFFCSCLHKPISPFLFFLLFLLGCFLFCFSLIFFLFFLLFFLLFLLAHLPLFLLVIFSLISPCSSSSFSSCHLFLNFSLLLFLSFFLVVLSYMCLLFFLLSFSLGIFPCFLLVVFHFFPLAISFSFSCVLGPLIWNKKRIWKDIVTCYKGLATLLSSKIIMQHGSEF
jgi:hypothetical protein